LEDLLLHARRRNKPSDFAGAWVMCDEEEEIKESLKELWERGRLINRGKANGDD